LVAYLLVGIAIIGLLICITGVVLSLRCKGLWATVLFAAHALLFIGLFYVADRGLFVGDLS
jgi:hypothetical protein